MASRKAIFIDKDGTLIPNIPYNVDPEKITLSSRAGESLALLQNKGYLIVVITNQSGVAKGVFKERELKPVENRLAALLAVDGVQLSGFYTCPHHPDGVIKRYTQTCSCRKPANGLLLKAAADLSIDLAGSWMIGDILNDVEAGNRAGCQSILLNNGNETAWENGPYRRPVFIAPDLYQAADFIINNASTYGRHHEEKLFAAH